MKVATIFVALAFATCFLSTVDSWRRRRRRRCYRNCTPGNWGGWSTCTRSCGKGTQARTRGISVPALCGGSCNYNLRETRYCNTQCCRVNCAWSWNSWGPCKGCGMSTKTRTLRITQYPSCRGTSCPSQRSQTISCNTGMWVIQKSLQMLTFFVGCVLLSQIARLVENPRCVFLEYKPLACVVVLCTSVLMFLTVDRSLCLFFFDIFCWLSRRN